MHTCVEIDDRHEQKRKKKQLCRIYNQNHLCNSTVTFFKWLNFSSDDETKWLPPRFYMSINVRVLIYKHHHRVSHTKRPNTTPIAIKCIKWVPTCSESSPCWVVGFQEFIALACTLLGYALFVTKKCKDFMLMLHVIPRLHIPL